MGNPESKQTVPKPARHDQSLQSTTKTDINEKRFADEGSSVDQTSAGENQVEPNKLSGLPGEDIFACSPKDDKKPLLSNIAETATEDKDTSDVEKDEEKQSAYAVKSKLHEDRTSIDFQPKSEIGYQQEHVRDDASAINPKRTNTGLNIDQLADNIDAVSIKETEIDEESNYNSNADNVTSDMVQEEKQVDDYNSKPHADESSIGHNIGATGTANAETTYIDHKLETKEAHGDIVLTQGSVHLEPSINKHCDKTKSDVVQVSNDNQDVPLVHLEHSNTVDSLLELNSPPDAKDQLKERTSTVNPSSSADFYEFKERSSTANSSSNADFDLDESFDERIYFTKESVLESDRESQNVEKVSICSSSSTNSTYSNSSSSSSRFRDTFSLRRFFKRFQRKKDRDKDIIDSNISNDSVSSTGSSPNASMTYVANSSIKPSHVNNSETSNTDVLIRDDVQTASVEFPIKTRNGLKYKFTWETNDNRPKCVKDESQHETKYTYGIYSNVIFLPDKTKGASPKRQGPKRLGSLMPLSDRDSEAECASMSSVDEAIDSNILDRKNKESSISANDKAVVDDTPGVPLVNQSSKQTTSNNELEFVEDHFGPYTGCTASGVSQGVKEDNLNEFCDTGMCSSPYVENQTRREKETDPVSDPIQSSVNLETNLQQLSEPPIHTNKQSHMQRFVGPSNQDSTVPYSKLSIPTFKNSTETTPSIPDTPWAFEDSNTDEENQRCFCETLSPPIFGKNCTVDINWGTLKSKQGQFARNLRSSCTNIAEDNRLCFEFKLPFKEGRDENCDKSGQPLSMKLVCGVNHAQAVVDEVPKVDYTGHVSSSPSASSQIEVMVNEFDSDEDECRFDTSQCKYVTKEKQDSEGDDLSKSPSTTSHVDIIVNDFNDDQDENCSKTSQSELVNSNEFGAKTYSPKRELISYIDDRDITSVELVLNESTKSDESLSSSNNNSDLNESDKSDAIFKPDIQTFDSNPEIDSHLLVLRAPELKHNSEINPLQCPEVKETSIHSEDPNEGGALIVEQTMLNDEILVKTKENNKYLKEEEEEREEEEEEGDDDEEEKEEGVTKGGIECKIEGGVEEGDAYARCRFTCKEGTSEKEDPGEVENLSKMYTDSQESLPGSMEDVKRTDIIFKRVETRYERDNRINLESGGDALVTNGENSTATNFEQYIRSYSNNIQEITKRAQQNVEVGTSTVHIQGNEGGDVESLGNGCINSMRNKVNVLKDQHNSQSSDNDSNIFNICLEQTHEGKSTNAARNTNLQPVNTTEGYKVYTNEASTYEHGEPRNDKENDILVQTSQVRIDSSVDVQNKETQKTYDEMAASKANENDGTQNAEPGNSESGNHKVDPETIHEVGESQAEEMGLLLKPLYGMVEESFPDQFKRFLPADFKTEDIVTEVISELDIQPDDLTLPPEELHKKFAGKENKVIGRLVKKYLPDLMKGFLLGKFNLDEALTAEDVETKDSSLPRNEITETLNEQQRNVTEVAGTNIESETDKLAEKKCVDRVKTLRCKKTEESDDNRLVPVVYEEDKVTEETHSKQSESEADEHNSKSTESNAQDNPQTEDLGSLLKPMFGLVEQILPDEIKQHLPETFKLEDMVLGSLRTEEFVLPPHKMKEHLEKLQEGLTATLLSKTGEEEEEIETQDTQQKIKNTDQKQTEDDNKDRENYGNAGDIGENSDKESDTESDFSVQQSDEDAEIDPENIDTDNEPLVQLDDANWDAVVRLETIKCREATESPAKLRCTVLCVDISGSMIGEPREQMRNVLDTFVKDIEDIRSKHGTTEVVSMVTFGHETKVAMTPTTDYSQILTTFDKLEVRGNTPLEPVLLLALFPVLVSSNNRYDFRLHNQVVRHRVILLTDGHPTPHKMLSENDFVTDSQAKQAVSDVVKKMKFLNARNLRNIMNIHCVPIGSRPNMELLEIIAKKSGGQIIPCTDVRTLSANTHNYLTSLQITRHLLESAQQTLDKKLLKSIINTLHPGCAADDVGQMIYEIEFEFKKNKKQKEKEKKTFSGLSADDDNNSDTDSDESSHSNGFENDSLTEVEGMPKIGTRIKRGPDFDPTEIVVSSETGTITGHSVRNKKCLFVMWDCGVKTWCRYGERDCYDVMLDDIQHVKCKLEDNIRVGHRVRRGPDWKYGDQDGGSDQLGTVYNVYENGVEVQVRWDNGNFGLYRYNYDGAYDVLLSPPDDPFDVHRHTHEMNRRNLAKIRGIDINSTVNYRHERLDLDLTESLFGLDLDEPTKGQGDKKLNKNAFAQYTKTC